MNPVVHFEMPYADSKRAVKFYTNVFGWKAQQMGPDMQNYVVVETTESGKDGRPGKPGTINGGLYPKSIDKSAIAPSFVIGVDDIKVHMKKIEKSGGKILGTPLMIPKIGWYVSFEDTEGNKLSLLQPQR